MNARETSGEVSSVIGKPVRALRTPEQQERIKDVERRYRARNKDKLRERTRAYRERNRDAINARNRERYRADPETYRKRTRNRQVKDPAGVRRSQWKYLYGVTPDQFERMFNEQGKACAICRTTHFARHPHIDHCHETGRVRGILCDPCNRGLGTFRDDPARLEAAAAYLRSKR